MPILLIAGGIGITPFASQLADRGATAGSDVVVIHALAGAEEVGYGDVLENSDARVIIVSPTPIDGLPETWERCRCRIDEDLLQRTVPDVTTRMMFISGPPALGEQR